VPRAATRELVRQAMVEACELRRVTVLGPGEDFTVDEARALAGELRLAEPRFYDVRIWVSGRQLYIGPFD
jgi:hypothetical protein